ncbi:kinase-like domain-containing protein [Cadophora sp. MPI-SDFR-AT-0126]|nr:kinase-like domain-containing protein [Leotiomycetes sp. MPI-SDFR-AT-0126]
MTPVTYQNDALDGVPNRTRVRESDSKETYTNSGNGPNRMERIADKRESNDGSNPTRPWSKHAELELFDGSHLEPPSSVGIPLSESDLSNVIIDLGDGMQLAQPKDGDRVENWTGKEVLFLHTGAGLQESDSVVYTTQPIFREGTGEAAERESETKAKHSLGRKIRGAMEESSWEKEVKEFLPMDKLDLIITRTAVHEELELKNKDLSLVEEILTKRVSSSGTETTRRKIFAILVLINQITTIDVFVQNEIYDIDLPFVFRKGAGERTGTLDVYRKSKGSNPDGQHDEVKIDFFETWEDEDLYSFDSIQWKLLAPYFSLVSEETAKWSHYDLESNIILPFVQDDLVDAPLAQYGGSSEGGKTDHPSFAVKRLNSNDRTQFKREVDVFKRFIGVNKHPNLISLLLTYSYRGHYHLLFHWADGNLFDYWKDRYPFISSPIRDENFAKWVCKQWLGVTEALQAIHTYTPDPALPLQDAETQAELKYGRHGDIKPENILWFASTSDHSPGSFGSFVISDFGLMSFHHKETKSRLNPANLARSHTYRPPEFDVRKKVSQKCDMWSLGCVLLEFFHWYLLGWEGVYNFGTERAKDGPLQMRLDDFFNGTRDKEAFPQLRNHPRATRFVVGVLELVESRLLRMDPTNRTSCDGVVAEFREFDARCSSIRGYCTDPFQPKITERKSTDLSELASEPLIANKFDAASRGAKQQIVSDMIIRHNSLTTSPRKVRFEVEGSAIRLNGNTKPGPVYDSIHHLMDGRATSNHDFAPEVGRGQRSRSAEPSSRRGLEPDGVLRLERIRDSRYAIAPEPLGKVCVKSEVKKVKPKPTENLVSDPKSTSLIQRNDNADPSHRSAEVDNEHRSTEVQAASHSLPISSTAVDLIGDERTPRLERRSSDEKVWWRKVICRC